MASLKGGELWSGNDSVWVCASCCWVVRCLGSSPQLAWPRASWPVALNLKQHCSFAFVFLYWLCSTSFTHLSYSSFTVTVSLWHLVVSFMSYLNSPSSHHHTNPHIANTHGCAHTKNTVQHQKTGSLSRLPCMSPRPTLPLCKLHTRSHSSFSFVLHHTEPWR